MESAHSLPSRCCQSNAFQFRPICFLLVPAEDSKNKLKNKKTMNNAKVAASVQVRRPDDLPLEGDGRKKSIVKADDDTIRSDRFDFVFHLTVSMTVRLRPQLPVVRQPLPPHHARRQP